MQQTYNSSLQRSRSTVKLLQHQFDRLQLAAGGALSMPELLQHPAHVGVWVFHRTCCDHGKLQQQRRRHHSARLHAINNKRKRSCSRSNASGTLPSSHTFRSSDKGSCCSMNQHCTPWQQQPPQHPSQQHPSQQQHPRRTRTSHPLSTLPSSHTLSISSLQLCRSPQCTPCTG